MTLLSWWFSTKGDCIPPGSLGTIWKRFGSHAWTMLPASGGWRPAMLLNAPQHTGWPSPWRMTQPQMANGATVRNADDNEKLPVLG